METTYVYVVHTHPTGEQVERYPPKDMLLDCSYSFFLLSTIDPKEIKCAMQSLGLDVKNPMIFRMIADLEKDGYSSIDFEEFMEVITSKLGNKDTREGIQRIFNLFDDDKTGAISLKNLKRVAKELGETLTDEELRDMIDRADSKGEGEISFEDFYTIMTKKSFL
ncbi:hypothetical protein PVMG_00615 [Plasmodium vivax Mauritania I]|uniref:EF-hand domain-containing protein n=1 Tax=Plasmodium vivax Mauritania I TaxID=1035515 RepID=A0A0J9TAP6_PLAVI|nr:hypothetical protein PVMG_00615 [Plasmodium vivax Mauritania I]